MHKYTTTVILLLMTFSVSASDNDVELLNVYKSTEYKVNKFEYKDMKEPVNAVVITVKFNHPKGEIVKTVNGGEIFIVTKNDKKRFGEYAGNVLHSAAFSPDKYRRLYGEILNNDLGECTIHQYMIVNYNAFPNDFDVELVNVGVNEKRNNYKFRGIVIK